jgi:pyridoxal 5'-phosphate synthase pdxT subunit
MKIGVLALQGAFAEHIEILSHLHVEAIPVRLPVDLVGIDALVIPGGESTTIRKLLADYDLVDPIKNLIGKKMPVLGTCAGMVLLAKKVIGDQVEPLGAIDIEVERNAYGRQVDSFEIDLPVPVLGDQAFRGIFIRAPLVQKIEPEVEVLCRINNCAVAVKQGKVLACAFHPELTGDARFHKYFLNLITGDNIAEGNH